MGQRSEVAGTTGIRRVLRVLRPLALLGGFVVMWWCLATGAAQADQGPDRDLGTTHRTLAATADKVVRQPAHRAADQVRGHRTAPAKVAEKVRQHTVPVVSETRAIVRSTPAEPIVTKVSDTVSSRLTKVVEHTRTTLDSTPVGDAVIPELADVVEVAESSTLQGQTRSFDPSVAAVADALTTVSPSFSTAFAAVSSSAAADQGRAAPSSPLGGGSDTPALPSSGNSSSSAAQSGSGSGTGAALCGTGLDITLAATRTDVSSLADWRLAGPAYPPASSPD